MSFMKRGLFDMSKTSESGQIQSNRALEGLKVLDFTWVVAGPVATKLLGAHGATVIKVESTKRLDIFRGYQPMAGGIPGVNRSAVFDSYNHDKLGMTLDLSKQAGIRIAKKLAEWADVVVENFTPGTMEKLGLSYEDIRKVNPDIIMVSLSLQGQTGPGRNRTGFGNELQALAGYNNFVRWPGQPPEGMQNPYTDWIVPWLAVISILAAIEHRDQIGEGQYIDISQLEPGVLFLSVPVMDYVMNGNAPEPKGNRSDYSCPHGVYRCLGNDRWCAVAASNDEQWASLCKALGNPVWSGDERFETIEGRRQNEDELDKLLEDWTLGQTAEGAMVTLQELGVPAGIVANGQDIYNDPGLRHRGHFKTLEHPEIGKHSYEMPSCRFSFTNDVILKPSPCLGEHTEYICTKVLGMTDEEFVRLMAEGVFE